MIFWLCEVARRARVDAHRKQVHIAAEMDGDQSTVYRFEKERRWVRDTDLFVYAYAADLGISPLDLWQRAIEAWAEEGEITNVEGLLDRKRQRAASGHHDD